MVVWWWRDLAVWRYGGMVVWWWWCGRTAVWRMVDFSGVAVCMLTVLFTCRCLLPIPSD